MKSDLERPAAAADGEVDVVPRLDLGQAARAIACKNRNAVDVSDVITAGE
jgi:hypothetical protein